MNGFLQAELLSTRKRPGVWIVGGAWAGLAVVFGMVVPYIVWLAIRNKPVGSSGDPEQLINGVLPDKFLSGTVDLYPMFGSALMLILGAVLVGGEYRWGPGARCWSKGPAGFRRFSERPWRQRWRCCA